MNLIKIIDELRRELTDIDHAIYSLERLSSFAGRKGAERPKVRRDPQPRWLLRTERQPSPGRALENRDLSQLRNVRSDLEISSAEVPSKATALMSARTTSTLFPKALQFQPGNGQSTEKLMGSELKLDPSG